MIARKTATIEPKGLLARLRADKAGNTLAIFAISIFPMVGLVGGAVDLGRMYAIKTRLQAACDAGSLAARKVMGNGRWDANNNGNLTDDPALAAGFRMFDANFQSTYLGTRNMTRNFTESQGKVTGTATATVPMELMQVVGVGAKELSVTCESEMKIPHSDVMFVLDVTGSMAQTIPGDTSGISKMDGLKVAVKCFYEALSRENITDVSPTQCGKTQDPVGDLSPLTQLRFGFVPFSSQVNVGALLQNGWFADQQVLQTRRPRSLSTQFTYTLGSIGTTTWDGNWTPSRPASYNTRESSSGWSDQTTNVGAFPFRQTAATNTTQCASQNSLGGSGGLLITLTEAMSGTPSNVLVSTSDNPPVHPVAQQTLTYSQTRPWTVTQYRYIWETRSGVTGCFLEFRAHTQTYNRTQGGTATRPVNWTQRNNVVTGGWTYGPQTVNVAGLKNGGGVPTSLSYNTTIQLPLNETRSSWLLSGQSSASVVRQVANRTITWSGCIEERQTFQNTDGDPSDDWNPIPSTALDMDIDMVPDVGDDTTRWKFMLPAAVWGRSDGSQFDGWSDGTPNNSTPVVTDVTIGGDPTNTQDVVGGTLDINAPCPTAAVKLSNFQTATGATALRNYVNSLTADGGTYHDIGLLWGARLMSPTGIFASENATTPNGQDIQRHMVFMTDGDTQNLWFNYTPYGIEGWDRRRTPSGTVPDMNLLNAAGDARTEALCRAIKNLGTQGTQLWVVYYGASTNVATYNRMQTCASSPNHFFMATSTASLIQTFNQIATSISELKLTN